MHEEAPIANEQYDLAFGNCVRLCLLHHQNVAGPNRRQHAPTCHLQPESAGGAQRVGRQFALEAVRSVRSCSGCHHEDLVLSPQPLWVTVILPQESAVVTNTCSNRNEGFSYGFLLPEVRGLSFDESFIAIRGNHMSRS